MYKITRCADNQTWDQRCVHYRTQTGQLFPISRQPLTLVIGQLLPHGSRMKAHSTPPPCGFMDFYFINKLWVDWHGMCASCASSQTASGNRKTTLSTQIGHPPTQQVLIYACLSHICTPYSCILLKTHEYTFRSIIATPTHHTALIIKQIHHKARRLCTRCHARWRPIRALHPRDAHKRTFGCWDDNVHPSGD